MLNDDFFVNYFLAFRFESLSVLEVMINYISDCRQRHNIDEQRSICFMLPCGFEYVINDSRVLKAMTYGYDKSYDNSYDIRL